jgi:hypothetical protein
MRPYLGVKEYIGEGNAVYAVMISSGGADSSFKVNALGFGWNHNKNSNF